ncbi:putative lysine 2,3-aminomutase [Actinobacillus pleuropneumoniae]|uniref:EF-P beta-lysylation protein EpmB n=1 Tax=Actinobacillus pleuropneumoniae TaxID=715 RepID=UPI0005859A92|nr:EF-P beta-lysylation protein EpmB [Actinobacillus pleuropneumoniae]KIE91444.1 putative lysine 2,3-aminomutase [Actinobacillus pleuropneumoniae]KIE91814.1 putative lysine 2,3-aminomutase [Actinobacillus pleuropneumoniae]KIE92128.1 putative lysine 2,3-aminomutase [Actinobacillus pleuropneumoniae]KIE96948.1 putative lysine 2,3-aminomutase [Actinobacillus pleuropneumoniae]KIE98430.1 putative lysine 2,3-aminomutase [Actinobacillus pleuropneumoniae]
MQPVRIESSKPEWLIELAQAFNDPAALLEYLELNPQAFETAITARKLFALRVPRAFAAKMQKGDKNDPLFLQAMSAAAEFLQAEGFVKDPLEEQHSPAPNILHKYHNRLLFMIKNSCAINCRYCFRRHFPYDDVKSGKAVWQQGLDYIAAHTELEEVIFSGGDPLMAKDGELDWLISALEQIPHIKTLRIHTRLPVVIPSRITEQLCDRLSKSRLKVVMVTHINHPNEVDEVLADKLNQLRQSKVVLLNQSVLLKGVNDNAQILKALSNKLFESGVLPYYLHLLDKVESASHFFIEDRQAAEIYKELQRITSGYLVPKLAREIAREPNKTLMG